jgi:hypothetical protein
MKKFYPFFVLLLMTAAALKGQVSVSASAGVANGSYPTLKAAFDEINKGTHQGVINILITASTTESATAQLNASEGTARYISVRIRPATDCIISGNIKGALIDLNGADSVTIDGRPEGAGSRRSLSLRNLYASEYDGASTIQLSNGAALNTIRYVNIEGSAGSTILIGAAVNSSQTNSYNTIDNNDIRPAGGKLPSHGIRSAPGDFYAPKNTNNVISNNLIHDFSSEDGSAAAIELFDPISVCIVTGNSIYQSVPLAFEPGRGYAFLNIYGGSGHQIKHNFIGGSAPEAGGQPAVFSIVDGMAAMYVHSGDPYTTTISENIITNIHITNTSVTASTEFGGIRGIGGSFLINGNTVGSLSGTGAITIDYINAVPKAEVAGINCNGNGTVTIQNNKVGAITVNGAAGNNTVLEGLKVDYFKTAQIDHNLIGGPVAGSLQLNATSGKVQGIVLGHMGYTSQYTCAENTVQHLYNNSTGNLEAIIDGIYNTLPLDSKNSPAITKIADNRISHLHTTNRSAMNGSVAGINTRWIEVSNHLTLVFMNDSIVANQISELSSESAGQLTEVSGIVHNSPHKYLKILSNTIHNLRSAAANTDTMSNTAVQGICVRMTRELTDQMPAEITGNKLYNLAGTASAATVVSGISAGNRTSQLFTISKNQIYDLRNEKASKGFVAGMLLRGYGGAGIFAVNNNMISLSPANVSVYGLLIQTNVEELRFYYNSIAISGTAAGASRSSAFYRAAAASTRILSSDNILYNARQGASGQHYALINGHTTPSTGWNYSNYNDLYSSNTATVALWGNTPMTFIAFQTNSLRDRCSKNIAPDFSDIAVANLRLQDTYVNHALTGNPVAGITSDIDGEARHTIPSMGADEIVLPVERPVITASGPVTFCQGGQVTLSSSIASGNRWYRNGVLIPNASTQSYQATQGGFYKTVITDGCITLSSDSIGVTVNPVPDTPVISRSGDTLFSSASSGNQWLLYDQPVSGATGQYFIPAQAGQYTVQVKINDCEATSAPFTYGPVCTLSLSSSVTPALCYGSATGKVMVTVEGGTAPFTYLWSNGAGSKDLSGVAAGDYTLSVTDAQGCKGSMAVSVSQPDSLRLSETHNNITCDKFALGSIDLSVSGGTAPYRYQWNNGATTQDLIWLKAGKYSALVTDANGCRQTIAATIAPAPADCNQKQITLYPNPATTVVNLKITGYNENMLLTVYDIYLRKRIEQKITVTSQGVTTINVQQLTAGPYLLLLTTSDGTVSRWFLRL